MQAGSGLGTGMGIPIMTPAPAMLPGGLGKRLLARIVDGIILAVATFPIGLVLGAGQLVIQSLFRDSGLAPQVLIQVLSFVINTCVSVAYYCWFYAKKGGSPGKLLLGLKVVHHETGAHLTPGKTVLRETLAVWVFSAGLLLLGLTFWLALGRTDRRTVADLIADTQVLQKKVA